MFSKHVSHRHLIKSNFVFDVVVSRVHDLYNSGDAQLLDTWYVPNCDAAI